MKFLTECPFFECFEQLSSNALAYMILQNADHDICAMSIPAKASAVCAQETDKPIFVLGHKYHLIVLGKNASDALGLFFDAQSSFARLQHHELGFLIQQLTQAQEFLSITFSDGSDIHGACEPFLLGLPQDSRSLFSSKALCKSYVPPDIPCASGPPTPCSTETVCIWQP